MKTSRQIHFLICFYIIPVNYKYLYNSPDNKSLKIVYLTIVLLLGVGKCWADTKIKHSL